MSLRNLYISHHPLNHILQKPVENYVRTIFWYNGNFSKVSDYKLITNLSEVIKLSEIFIRIW